MADLHAVEARLWELLRAHQPPLVDATIYNMPSLTWPGTKGHEYFAAVKRASKHVGLFMIIMERYPEALEGCSAELLKRRTGKSTLQFSSLDDLAAELEELIARLFDAYSADHAG
ncbi:DUF1801 domain-containing protein [Aestuariimicrobium ganziense]|uniref:DUF1801 domain-containing protein n=1 Tax=Aestuariimicrobium ganziense TaxID=2773677 RepID=UPI0019425155|nr:DUF1801 domain-containing protein [Aestuariimicrobium ganziense]